MARQALQAVNLSQLSDGYAGKVIDAAIASVNSDLVERGDDGKPRKITIVLTYKPEGNGNVDVEVDVKTALPALKPPKTTTKYDHRAGGLMFNPDCSKNPDQMTFNDIPTPGADNEG